jgi:hypothetical protein
MKNFLNVRLSLALLLVLSLFSGLALSACNGTTLVDVNIDPTTGTGNIIVTGNQDDNSSTDNGAGSAQVGNTDMSQVVLFGVIIALLLGTAAIVISATRRPREE